MTTLRTLFLISIFACASNSNQKPFDQMTAREHRTAAIREHELADASFTRAREKLGDADESGESEGPQESWYGYNPYYDAELGDPETYTVWPRVHVSGSGDGEDAGEHREKALRHERAAALLEGRPSPQPLPPTDDEIDDET